MADRGSADGAEMTDVPKNDNAERTPRGGSGYGLFRENSRSNSVIWAMENPVVQNATGVSGFGGSVPAGLSRGHTASVAGQEVMCVTPIDEPLELLLPASERITVCAFSPGKIHSA